MEVRIRFMCFPPFHVGAGCEPDLSSAREYNSSDNIMQKGARGGDAAEGEVSEILRAWSGGDLKALERLTPVVYGELHRLARHYMKRERSGHSLQTTALVNEAYMRL